MAGDRRSSPPRFSLNSFSSMGRIREASSSLMGEMEMLKVARLLSIQGEAMISTREDDDDG